MASKPAHSPFAEAAADRIDTLGETLLLRNIRHWLGKASPAAPQGIGDDCAVWPQPPEGEQLLFTTDAIVYGRHFDATCPPQLAAAKLLKRNLSDIAAMGGTPHSALLALTLPRNLSLRWLEQFYLGLRDCALHYATPITGGDITEGTDDFFAAHITLVGHARRPLLRSGARIGDHLFVTGALGGSLLGHHLHFEPRLEHGRWLAAQPDVRAMIDITDGLAKDLPELLPEDEACPAIALLELGKLPLSPAANATAEPKQRTRDQAIPADSTNLAGTPLSSPADSLPPAILAALCDGEDYELLFAVDGQTDPQAFVARWQAFFGQSTLPSPSCASQPASPCHIGTIASSANHPTDAPRLYNTATRTPLPLAKNGFQHLGK